MELVQADAIDPADFVRALRAPGAAAYPLLGDGARAALAGAARSLEYEVQPEEVGPPERRVRQRLASLQMGTDAGAFAPLAAAVEAFVAGIHGRLSAPPWPHPPAFNDFLAQRYPPGPYALTPHLDGKRYTELVAIAVLEGEARFCVCADRAGAGRVEIPAPPGSVIFMRAPGFEGAGDGRPFHCVLEVTRERYTIGMRRNSRIA